MNIKSERSVKYLIYSDLKRAGGVILLFDYFPMLLFQFFFGIE